MLGIVDTSYRARETLGILRRMKTATTVIMILAKEMSLLLLCEIVLLDPRKIL